LDVHLHVRGRRRFQPTALRKVAPDCVSESDSFVVEGRELAGLELPTERAAPEAAASEPPTLLVAKRDDAQRPFLLPDPLDRFEPAADLVERVEPLEEPHDSPNGLIGRAPVETMTLFVSR